MSHLGPLEDEREYHIPDNYGVTATPDTTAPDSTEKVDGERLDKIEKSVAELAALLEASRAQHDTEETEVVDSAYDEAEDTIGDTAEDSSDFGDEPDASDEADAPDTYEAYVDLSDGGDGFGPEYTDADAPDEVPEYTAEDFAEEIPTPKPKYNVIPDDLTKPFWERRAAVRKKIVPLDDNLLDRKKTDACDDAVDCVDLDLDTGRASVNVARADISRPVIPITHSDLGEALRTIFAASDANGVPRLNRETGYVGTVRPTLWPPVYAEITFKSDKPMSEAMWVTHFNNLTFLKSIEPVKIKWNKRHLKIGTSKEVVAVFELTQTTAGIETYKNIFVMKNAEKRAAHARLQADVVITNVNCTVMPKKVVIKRENAFDTTRAEALGDRAGFPMLLATWDVRTLWAKLVRWNRNRQLEKLRGLEFEVERERNGGNVTRVG